MPLLETFANASARGYGFGLPDAAGGPAYEQIATVILGSPSASITFSSIPTTYKHLQLRGSFNANTSNASTGLGIQFNGSSSAEYNAHWLQANGSSVSSSFNGLDVAMRFSINAPGNGASSIYSSMVFDILDYTSTTKNKTIRGMGGVAFSSNNQIVLGSGIWVNTAAINSITLLLNSGIQMFTSTRVSLYGIRG